MVGVFAPIGCVGAAAVCIGCGVFVDCVCDADGGVGAAAGGVTDGSVTVCVIVPLGVVDCCWTGLVIVFIISVVFIDVNSDESVTFLGGAKISFFFYSRKNGNKFLLL